MQIKKIIIFTFILFTTITIGWLQFKDLYIGSSAAKKNSLVEVNDIDIFKGMLLFASNCSSCHMNDLSGNSKWKSSFDEDELRLPPPLNGTGHTWHHNPEQLFNIIRYGYKKFDPNYEGKMLGNENLTDDEIWSILEYIKSIWPENIRIKYNSNFGGL